VFESQGTCFQGGNLQLEAIDYRPATAFPIFQINGMKSGRNKGVGTATTTTMAMTIPERAAALEAWNEAWTTPDEIVCEPAPREPNVRFAMPSGDELRGISSVWRTSRPGLMLLRPAEGQYVMTMTRSTQLVGNRTWHVGHVALCES